MKKCGIAYKTTLLSLLCLILMPTMAWGGNTDSLSELRERIMTFTRLIPQEKVYLHLDNTGYFLGETIWMKAYVVRTDIGRLSDMSGVLYVELLSPSGEVVETRKLKIDDGQADGCLPLTGELMKSGFYELRAYTRYMTNWGADGIFSRTIPVFSGDIQHPTIDEENYRRRVPNERTQDSLKTKRMNVRFYPEGGRLVSGLDSRVAFEVFDEKGEHIETNGWVVCGDDTISTAETLREGRGVFTVRHNQSDRCKLLLIDKRGKQRAFDLPTPSAEGCVMTVNATDSLTIGVAVAASQSWQGRQTALMLSKDGMPVAFERLSLDTIPQRFSFRKSEMDEGVNQFTLLSATGDVLADRLVFIYPKSADNPIEMSFDDGKPVLHTTPNTTFSLAIRDRLTEVNGSNGNAKTWLLLSSELKGYIANADYYFEADDETHRRAADLLMMVQGWRRYDFNTMTGKSPFIVNQQVERKLSVDGRIFPKKKDKKVGNVPVNITLYNRQGNVVTGKQKTDKRGFYSFNVPDCEGEWAMHIRAGSGDEDYGIGLNRNFSPKPRALSWAECRRIDDVDDASIINEHRGNDSLDSLANEGDKQGTARNSHRATKSSSKLLNEVTVKGRRIFDDARVAWESEKRGVWAADIYYNIDRECDRLLDEGKELPTITEWLKQRNSFFEGNEDDSEWVACEKKDQKADELIFPGDDISYNMSILLQGEEFDEQPRYIRLQNQVQRNIFLIGDGMTYKSHTIVWILNNGFYQITSAPRTLRVSDLSDFVDVSIEQMPRSLDEFKSAYISDNRDAWQRYVNLPKLSGGNITTVFLYTHHEFPPAIKGLRRTRFDAFARRETFQPYDGAALPDELPRRTLYWNPNLKTDTKGNVAVDFHTDKDIVVSAEGITSNGNAIVNSR